MGSRRGVWVKVGMDGAVPAGGASFGWGVHASLQQSPYGRMCTFVPRAKGAYGHGAIIDHVSLSHLLTDLTI